MRLEPKKVLKKCKSQGVSQFFSLIVVGVCKRENFTQIKLDLNFILFLLSSFLLKPLMIYLKKLRTSDWLISCDTNINYK